MTDVRNMFAKALRDELTPSERDEFERAIGDDPALTREFEAFADAQEGGLENVTGWLEHTGRESAIEYRDAYDHMVKDVIERAHGRKRGRLIQLVGAIGAVAAAAAVVAILIMPAKSVTEDWPSENTGAVQLMHDNYLHYSGDVEHFTPAEGVTLSIHNGALIRPHERGARLDRGTVLGAMDLERQVERLAAIGLGRAQVAELAVQGAGGAQDVDGLGMAPAHAGAQQVQRRALLQQGKRAFPGGGVQRGQVREAFHHSGVMLWRPLADRQRALEPGACRVQLAHVATAAGELCMELGGHRPQPLLFAQRQRLQRCHRVPAGAGMAKQPSRAAHVGRCLQAQPGWRALQRGDDPRLALLQLQGLRVIAQARAQAGDHSQQFGQRDRLLLALREASAGGKFPPEERLAPLWQRIGPEDVVVALGDFFDEDSATLLERLAATRREVLAIQLLTVEERDFPFDDGHRFRDPETGDEVPGDGPAMREGFLARFGAAQRALQARFDGAGIRHAGHVLDQPLDLPLRRLFGAAERP